MKEVESIILFCFLVGLGACIDDQLTKPTNVAPPSRTYPNVDQRLWSHFMAFEEAAAGLGYKIDLSQTDIQGVIEKIHEDNVAGTCSYGGYQDRAVTLDETFWYRSSPAYREYIVFHELGHCYLGRGHREGCRTNNTYLSLMRSGVDQQCRDFYNSQTRDYYIRELFSALERP